MLFEFTPARKAISLAFMVGAALAGCGGGSSTNDDTPTQSAVTTATGTTTNTGTAASTDTTEAVSDTAASTTTVSTNKDGVPSTTSGSDATDVSTTGSSSSDADNLVASVTPTPDVTALAVSTSTAAATTSGSTVKAASSSRSGVGMNLTSVNSYSTQIPTIDLMKKASPWITQCQNAYQTCANFSGTARAYDTLEEASLDLDADGWVKSLPAASDSKVKYRSVTTKIAEGGVQQAGNYTVVWDGSGTITYSGKATKIASLSSANHDVISVVNDAVGVYVNIVATDPKNYIRNIRVYAPGGACKSDLTTYKSDASACTAAAGAFVPFEKFPAGTVWHPAFLASVKGFRTLRFMDWGQTNYTQAVAWTDRTLPTARSWYTTTGVPLDYMLDLAAKAGSEPWVNIPAHANDDYVHQWARDAHAHLAAGSKINVEYGNEMWNWSFAATRWVYAQGKATWPSSDIPANQVLLVSNWYAMRTAQVCNIVKAEFGADAGRVQCVANTQAAAPITTDAALKCTLAQSTLGKPCSSFIDVVAIAPYFGYYFQNNAAIGTAMSAWYTDSDGGLAKMFQEINGTDASGNAVVAPLSITAGTKIPTGALAQTVGWMAAQHAITAKYNIPLWAYEGGQSLVPTRGDTGMLNLMVAANRDPRMGATYQAMLTAWKNAGGQTFALFADVGAYGGGGMWGLRESQFDTNSPKWKVAAQWRDQACWWSGC